jgi:hypothetical protein
LRLYEANLTVNRPDITQFKGKIKFSLKLEILISFIMDYYANIEGGKNLTFFHNHKAEQRPRDKKRFEKQKQEALQLDQTGLNNIKYRIDKLNEIKINNLSCLVVDVELSCNKQDTHWCSMSYQFLND